MMTKHKAKVEVDMPQAVLTMVKANIMAYVVTAIFILFSSIILTYTNASPKFEVWIVTLGVIASAFLAGFDTAKVDNKNGYKWGAIGGSLYFIIFLVLGTIIEKLNHLAPSVIFMLALLVIMSSTIAGMISVNCHK
ncbi:TIGR04086 family membrane protein [Cellulosilyticum sp. WCF-2]|nr:TIGR04086 family membrane protein [Cellulosilyticum sp. WCF-2]